MPLDLPGGSGEGPADGSARAVLGLQRYHLDTGAVGRRDAVWRHVKANDERGGSSTTGAAAAVAESALGHGLYWQHRRAASGSDTASNSADRSGLWCAASVGAFGAAGCPPDAEAG